MLIYMHDWGLINFILDPKNHVLPCQMSSSGDLGLHTLVPLKPCYEAQHQGPVTRAAQYGWKCAGTFKNLAVQPTCGAM